jgi:hypothetical protein
MLQPQAGVCVVCARQLLLLRLACGRDRFAFLALLGCSPEKKHFGMMVRPY